MKRLQFLATILLLMGMVACGDDAPKKKSKVEKDNQTEEVQQQVEETPVAESLYGIALDGYITEDFEIQRGENVGSILTKYGVAMAKIIDLGEVSKDVFDVKRLQAGKRYTLFLRDNIADYMVYHINDAEYVVYNLSTDTPSAVLGNTITE